MKHPKAFVSYSWDDENHKSWVKELATRLRSDGIETMLDQWHAIPGDQLPAFMEREIRDNDYVLIICTKNYQLKSDQRKGGVGYEGDIMTAEVHTDGNHRKFIPIIAHGAWSDVAPSWLKSKYFIDLSTEEKWDSGYEDLIATILGTREKAPPVGKPAASLSKLQSTPAPNASEIVKIIGVIVDKVTEPRIDGTAGSALYTVPFQLNKQPSDLWGELFINKWNSPPRYTSMHRPRIASVSGDAIILSGTTLEEVKKYHRDTLILCVDEANKAEAELVEKRKKQLEQEKEGQDSHRRNIRNIARDIDFN